jgi:beta-galactosidase
LTIPQRSEGFTLFQGVSAILPFNLRLGEGVLLKYATAQLLTKLRAGSESTTVFFAPEGMAAEFALDRATYRSIEITGGTLSEDETRGYVSASVGQTCRIAITTVTGTSLHLLVLTQEQAMACWKVQLWGEERLLFSDALLLCQDDELHLSWHGKPTVDLAFYPPLTREIVSNVGELDVEKERIFTRYRLTVPEHKIDLDMQTLSPTLFRIGIPAHALEGADDAFLRIDYLGDTGQAYLDGQLVGDHFANGLPWEIGLKRFVIPGEERELILRISPLTRNSTALSYFPTGMAFRPVADGNAVSEVHALTALPEYHITLAQRFEQTTRGAGL